MKTLLALIAAMRMPGGTQDGWSWGKQFAQAYKGCKVELSQPAAWQQWPDQLSEVEPSSALKTEA